jgi:hypothetical protein
MITSPGTTSLSIDVQIVDDSGLPVTGLVASTFPAVTYSVGNNTAAVAITLSDLAAITSVYSSGGLKERSGGRYRLDLPNAAIASAGVVTLIGEATGKHLICPPVQVVSVASQTSVTALQTTVGAPAGASLSADVAAVKADSGGIRADYTTARAVKIDHLLSDTTAAVTLPTVDGLTMVSVLEALLAFVGGKASVSDNGDTTKTVTFKKQDGVTTKLTITYATTGARSATSVS